ncbi:M56 family metallopeptidase [Terriglobus roseus]|uniref:Soil-associated protein, TIGR03435 family n=1 Tax=Terriglobus roseus TaxID=392734 RepID=A0A1H4NKI7_9BACT|nr:M56 family metallopeptidase [Terriglobus roseus]SEB95415.1 soil-associated protein, TIGR03435 family [Terriglobus roseus]
MSHLTISPHPFLIALFRHLWQTTLFALALAVLAMLLRGNRAALRFRVWMLASVKFLLPLSLLISAGQHLRPEKLQTVAPVAFTMVMQGAPDDVALGTLSLPVQPRTQAQGQVPHDVTTLLLIAWACGALTLLAVWARRWTALFRAVRSGDSAGRHEGIRAVRVAAPFEPGVFGILRPVLVLPHGLEAALTPTQMTAVLAHEISHLRRRDNLTAAIHMVVQTLFWFHPMVWMIGRRLVKEREAACDAAVLEMRIDPAAYAEGILKVCRLYLEAPLPCVAGVTGADLKQRIRSIATGNVGRQLRRVHAVGLGVLGIVAISAPVAFGVLHAAVLKSAMKHPSAAAVLHAALSPEMTVTPTPKLRLPQAPPPPPVPPPPPPPPDPIATNMPAIPAMTNVQVHPSNPYMPGTGYGFEQPTDLTHVRFRASNNTVADMISFAYGVQAKQIIDGPRWIDTERYDVTANVVSPQVPPEQIQAMMRRMLADHFGIRVHPARRDLQVYVLTVSKDGHHLRPDETNPHGLPRLNLMGAGTLVVSNASIRDFCSSLQGYAVDRPLVDRTGLNGRWYFDLQWHPDAAFFAALNMAEPRNLADDKSPPLLIAIRQQLGLNVEPTTLPMNVLVLDRASRPRAD